MLLAAAFLLKLLLKGAEFIFRLLNPLVAGTGRLGFRLGQDLLGPGFRVGFMILPGLTGQQASEHYANHKG
ncbi:hypothetical protein GCM10027346_23520 [Hymenobacter seoulensis]